MLYNRTIYDLASIVKFVADKVGPADRHQVLMLLKGIVNYVEKFETSTDVQYDDPLITLNGLIHAIEDVNAFKQPILLQSKASESAKKLATTVKRPLKTETIVVLDHSPYKQPRTLFTHSSALPTTSTPAASRHASVKRPPESDSDDGGGDYPADYSDDDEQVEEEVVETEWQPIDMLEKALSAIANEQVQEQYGKTSTSAVQVTKKKKTKSTKTLSKSYLDEDTVHENPTPRPWSAKYGGRKWPANQPFVCPYCRQILHNVGVYKNHLTTKHKNESPCQCRFCRKYHQNGELFKMHRCAKMNTCTICKKEFPRPSKLKRHMSVHMKTTIHRVTCGVCALQYRTAKECAVHIFNDHEHTVFCDSCLTDFDPSESPSTDGSRVFCMKCASNIPEGCAKPLFHGNPNMDVNVKSEKVNFNNSARAKEPNRSTGGYCEVCDETVNSIKSHEKTNRHVTKKAEKEGRELYMHHCQIDNCGKAFVSVERLSEHHERNHTGKVNFSCAQCKKEYYSKAAYTHHMRTHYASNNYKCPVCDRGFSVKSFLEDHKVTAHRDRYQQDFKCHHCEMVFTNRRRRTKHIAMYHKRYIYQCKDCEFVTREPNQITSHYQKHHPAAELQKPIKYRSVADHAPATPSTAGTDTSGANTSHVSQDGSSENMSYLMKMMHADLYFPKKCKACDDVTFDSLEEMKDHLTSSQTHSENVERIGPFSKTNPCGYCDIELPTGTALEAHHWEVNDHLDVKGKPRFICIGCARDFYTLGRFRAHFDNKICDKKKHTCEFCHEMFSLKSQLNAHVIAEHSTHRCPYCDSGFMNQQHLDTHKKLSHTYTAYHCSECDFVTKYMLRLKKDHMAKHHPDVQFEGAMTYARKSEGLHTEPAETDVESSSDYDSDDSVTEGNRECAKKVEAAATLQILNKTPIIRTPEAAVNDDGQKVSKQKTLQTGSSAQIYKIVSKASVKAGETVANVKGITLNQPKVETTNKESSTSDAQTSRNETKTGPVAITKGITVNRSKVGTADTDKEPSSSNVLTSGKDAKTGPVAVIKGITVTRAKDSTIKPVTVVISRMSQKGAEANNESSTSVVLRTPLNKPAKKEAETPTTLTTHKLSVSSPDYVTDARPRRTIKKIDKLDM